MKFLEIETDKGNKRYIVRNDDEEDLLIQSLNEDETEVNEIYYRNDEIFDKISEIYRSWVSQSVAIEEIGKLILQYDIAFTK